MPPIWSKTYEVNSLVLNPQKRLGLYGLLNLLSEAAWQHADLLGAGYDALQASGIFWVLTRQSVRMTEWPGWGEPLTIRTWARPFSGARAPRDFELYIGTRKVGEATTLWLVLDAVTRQPARLGALVDTVAARMEGALTLEAQKIPAREGGQEAYRFVVRYGDLDLNGHVGNTRYGQWVLDAMAPEELADRRIVGYDVNFLAEVRLGEEVVVFRGAPEPVSGQGQGQELGGTVVRHFQGVRGDGKVAFTAHLALSPI